MWGGGGNRTEVYLRLINYIFKEMYILKVKCKSISLLINTSGPLEFLAYVCPIYDIAQRHGISIRQHADDTQLYLESDLDKQQEAIVKMEALLNDIGLWM